MDSDAKLLKAGSGPTDAVAKLKAEIAKLKAVLADVKRERDDLRIDLEIAAEDEEESAADNHELLREIAEEIDKGDLEHALLLIEREGIYFVKRNRA